MEKYNNIICYYYFDNILINNLIKYFFIFFCLIIFLFEVLFFSLDLKKRNRIVILVNDFEKILFDVGFIRDNFIKVVFNFIEVVLLF